MPEAVTALNAMHSLLRRLIPTRTIILSAAELDALRTGRSCVARDGVWVYFD